MEKKLILKQLMEAINGATIAVGDIITVIAEEACKRKLATNG